MFICDNNGFDWQFIDWYLSSLAAIRSGFRAKPRLAVQGAGQGYVPVIQASAQTAHTHHPVDDAKGNAEALLAMKAMGLKIKL